MWRTPSPPETRSRNAIGCSERTVADNERALDLAQTSYRVGKIDLRAVQQQQLNLDSARLALLRVQSEQLSQRVNLHLVLGGSFASARANYEPLTARVGRWRAHCPSLRGSPRAGDGAHPPQQWPAAYLSAKRRSCVFGEGDPRRTPAGRRLSPPL